MKDEIAHMRQNYAHAELSSESLLADPVAQFGSWFEAATKSQVTEPNAMTLATASAFGEISARTVLLKGADEAGFSFFTNFNSRKGRDLADNPVAALTFHWKPIERQVCVRGRVVRVDDSESDDYFASRPYGSRIGAWVSEQSEVIESRKWLETRNAEFRAKYPEDGLVPRPPHWGGFRVIPTAIEFWQGRPSRLHDRFLYRRSSEGQDWEISRLSP